MEKFDVAFIGSGHANWHAAVTLRQAGKSVVIIEKDTIAGTCTNYGCDPKILLDAPFDLADQLAHYDQIGVTQPTAKVDWSALMTYKHQVIDPLATQMTGLFQQMGIQVIMGAGRLVDAHTIQVGDQQVTADKIVIGTGQRPARLNIAGQEFLHDSREFLDLTEFPEAITFIGAGIISLEFASIAVKMGAQVNVIEYGDRALGGFYQPYVKQVVQELQRQGARFFFNEAVTQVEQTATGFKVTTQSGLQVATDYVLDATGRIANVENLGLEQLGIQTNRGGIVVNDHLQTNVANIYASGDVLDKKVAKLTPTATFESNYIAAQILGLNDQPIQYPVVPSIVFTIPRLAQVGVTIADAQQSDQYQVVPVKYGQQMLFQSRNETEAEAMLVLTHDGHLAGATVYGSDGPDLVNFLALVINQHLTADDLDQQIFAFPSSSIGWISLITLAMRQVQFQQH